jgi:aerobic-type carbon monoxide dehydrogenase small subunit (CoxS/CutS family)
VVLSTINVANGQQPTIPELKAVLSDSVELDRTVINAWEDPAFRRAVEATGRRKLIMTALWTEVCLAFPALDALRDGFEVFPVVDAVGGTSPEAHRSGLERIGGAGTAACTVLIDGRNEKSCQTPARRAVGRQVQTVEGVSGPVVDGLRAAWHRENVVQCGYCQPGQTLAAVALLESTPRPVTRRSPDARRHRRSCCDRQSASNLIRPQPRPSTETGGNQT